MRRCTKPDFFTSSTSFANPAATIARTLSDTFTGIAPGSVPPFVVAQTIGAGLAIVAIRVLYPAPPTPGDVDLPNAQLPETVGGLQ